MNLIRIANDFSMRSKMDFWQKSNSKKIGGKRMKKIFFISLFLMISIKAFSCSPKQIWIPAFFVDVQGSEEYIGDNGNNYRFKIILQGNFNPGTRGIELQCGTDCCDLYDQIAKYRISYCIDQPCGCLSTMNVPLKCEDIPLAEFCDPERGLSCGGPYFREFDQFSGGVADPGMKGGCPANNQLECKPEELAILEFQGIFFYERGKNETYPFILETMVCVVEGIKQTGACRKVSIIIDKPPDICPDPCCPPECGPPHDNCIPSPSDECDDGGGGKCKGTLRVSSNGWITFRVLKQGMEVVPWTNLSNVNTNPALVANGPLSYQQLNCGTYDIEYDEVDQKEEGNEVCWTPGRHVTVTKNNIRDAVANKREWHHHVKFSDGHYEPHAPDKCPYIGTACNR